MLPDKVQVKCAHRWLICAWNWNQTVRTSALAQKTCLTMTGGLQPCELYQDNSEAAACAVQAGTRLKVVPLRCQHLSCAVIAAGISSL